MISAKFLRKLRAGGFALAAGVLSAVSSGDDASAATYTYDFTGAFGLSWSVSNLNGRAPIPGGTASGFFTINNDDPGNWVLLDYGITTVQPLIHVTDRQTEYDFDTRGVQPLPGLPVIGAAAGLPVYTAGGGALNFYNYDEGPFSGSTWAAAYQTLNMTFLPGDLGNASLSLALGEAYGDCSAFFTIHGPVNSCTAQSGQQYNGTGTATLRGSQPLVAPVPLPAAGLLLVAALGGLALGRKRRAAG